MLFCDITDLQQRHHPQNIPHTVEKIEGFPLRAKSFQNTATYQKLKGGGSINPPPVPPRENDFECTSLRVKSTGQRPVRKT